MVRTLELRITINRNKCSATAVYLGEAVTIMKGSVINMDPSPYARERLVKEYREDRVVVSDKGVLLRDCTFPSVSAAARFVTGRSENGYDAWKVEGDDTKLGDWLIKAGLREIKKRNGKDS